MLLFVRCILTCGALQRSAGRFLALSFSIDEALSILRRGLNALCVKTKKRSCLVLMLLRMKIDSSNLRIVEKNSG